MAKKKVKRKNPILKQRYEEGYNQGLIVGEKLGREFGRKQAILFFKNKFEGLYDVPGIGEKTLNKIKEQLGRQYFE